MKVLKMKLEITICFVILYTFITVAQETIPGKVVSLHIVVGDVITVDEKIKYTLFPELKDSLFQSALLILHPDSSYSFLIKPSNSKKKSFERPTNKAEIAEMISKIDKVPQLTSFDNMLQRINSAHDNNSDIATNNPPIYNDKLTKKEVFNFEHHAIEVLEIITTMFGPWLTLIK